MSPWLGSRFAVGTAWWHRVGTETWAWERHSLCHTGLWQLCHHSSAITALSEEALVASRSHFQSCPCYRNQRTELPFIPTVSQGNSTCVPTKGRGKAWSSHKIQSLSAISYKSFIERKFAEMPRWCFPAVCTQCIILPDCLSFPQDRHIHVYISKII